MANDRNSRLNRRRLSSRRQQESVRQRGLLLLGVIVILFIIGIPSFGYYQNIYSPPREVVIKVNETTYNLGYLVKILRMLQGGGSIDAQATNLGSLPFQIVQTLTENELISQGAARENIKVTEKQIDDEVRLRILGEIDNQETPADQLEREFEERYRLYLTQIQITTEEHRQIVRGDLYREQLLELLGDNVPSVLPHVFLYALPLDSADADQIADEVRTQYIRGESFESLVEQFATNEDTIRRGGEVGWVPQGAYVEQDPLFFEELNLNEISEPQMTFNPSSGEGVITFYVVTDRVEARNVEEKYRDILKSRSLQSWLAEEREVNDVRVPFNSDQYAWVINELQKSSTRR
ncbi:hypothetical protein FIM02_02265 [SAR202 cluster bacterium AD-802-E10_MRT_200m]|nr:hypothetical protein [SAR202 cluster bacterium AD-802-E10_MRT_200m]